MVKRPTCLCDGRLIGIESIYTVSEGKQINIEDKLEALRKRSRNKELFCPCGCGANVILVAGDRGLVNQHFRLWDNSQEKECQYVSEGEMSVCSKIVLKCWLEDKLPGTNIETRVPICAVDDTDRKYELTLLAKDKNIAVSYCHDRANLSDEKLGILDGNSAGISLHYIVDIANTGNRIQYPEMMMKIQKRQGYCLFLQLSSVDLLRANYADCELRAFYCCEENGHWNEIEIVSDSLSTFSFGASGELLYYDIPLNELREQREQAHLIELEQARQERERKAAERAAAQQRLQEERVRQQAERLEQQRKAEAERVEQIRLEREIQRRLAAEQLAQKQAAMNTLRTQVALVIDQDQENPFYDRAGNRWVKCERCGKVATENNFDIYGGLHRVNLGICKECIRKEAAQQKQAIPQSGPPGFRQPIPADDPDICPKCGGALRERSGPYGRFLGCSNFPSCRYSRPIIKRDKR